METGEEKVENSVQDIADDLIKLYAEREASKGYAFSPDHEMQRQFESAFLTRKQRTSSVPFRRLKRIWKENARWTVCFAVMWVTGRRR